MKTLKMGVGKCTITPPIGTDLFGYAPGIHSETVHDDLNITAVALEGNGERAMLVTVEVCLIQNELCEMMRKALSEETGIAYDHTVVSATHTHSGPTTVQMEGWGDLNWEYCHAILLPKTREAAKLAIAGMKPVEMGIGTTQSLVGCNRREVRADGTVHLGQKPWGPFDPTMTVLHFREPESRETVFTMVHYCCHGTANGRDPKISRDWSYAMLDELEKITGAPAGFFNGAVGDVGPRLTNGKTTGDITYVEELAQTAKFDALRAFKSIGCYTGDLPLKVLAAPLVLPLGKQPTPEDVEKTLADFLLENPEPEKLDNIKAGIYHHLTTLQKYYADGNPVPTERDLGQTLVSVGEVAFVPFPFEVFVEITLNVRRFSPYRFTLCLSNTNGANSYLPTEDQLIRGGYEVKSFYNENLFPFAENTDWTITEKNVALLKELHQL